jgi:hypothetical protein
MRAVPAAAKQATKVLKVSTILTGVSGEYFVAAELSRRGYVASVTLRNTRGIDILASNADATKSVGIQVKTIQVGKEWILSEAAEADSAANLYYAFVRLNGRGVPDYYIVPRAIVAAYARTEHQEWLATPGKKGQPHNQTSMRKFRDPSAEYRDGWALLGLDPLKTSGQSR